MAAGAVFLAISAVTSLMLSVDHLGGLSLPGCGAGSPCGDAMNGVWGSIPLSPDFKWPVAFIGLAYFLGALVAWLGSSRGVTPLFRNVARVGALISLGFVVILIKEGHTCWYCLASHAGNFAFWIAMEKARKASAISLRAMVRLALVFIVASTVLGAAEWRTREVVEADQQQQLEESIDAIIASDARRTAEAPPDAPPDVPDAEASTQQPEKQAEPTTGEPSPIKYPWEGGFKGRYVYGPEAAPIRVMMITDYQCVDCNRIEEEVRAMLDARDDVSLTIKHFPMCPACNRHFKKNKHPNACWAARAAETAGILGGSEGFWKVHFWLFDRDGSFTNEELQQGLAELGFDPAEFIRTMTSDETLQRVQSDIEDAIWLGLHYTPMVFINGVELKGVFSKNAIPRTVARVAANNPPALTHEADQPPPGSEKCVADWREQPVRNIPTDLHPWARGPERARFSIVLWGDYQEPFTAQACDVIEEFIAGRPDARFDFRHYPVNKACNPLTEMDLHPLACRASQAAEAAGALGGLDGYWKMHHWLLANQKQFSDQALRQAAVEMGFDADALFEKMEDPAVRGFILEDCQAGKRIGLRSIPMLFVNRKFVPRWLRDGDVVLESILIEAAGD